MTDFEFVVLLDMSLLLSTILSNTIIPVLIFTLLFGDQYFVCYPNSTTAPPMNTVVKYLVCVLTLGLFPRNEVSH